MTEQDSRTHRHADSAAVASGDEISLFDIWNVLVRRRWVVFAVFGLVVAVSLAFALTRPTTYRLSQPIEVGVVETANLPGEAAQELGSVKFFDTPAEAVSELENVHVPAARDALDASDLQDTRMGAPVTASVVDNSRLIRVSAEVPASQIAGYKKLMAAAAERLVEAHAEAKEEVSQKVRDVVRKAKNAAADIEDRLDARQDELDRLSTEEALITERIEELQKLLERTEAAHVEVLTGRPDVSQALTVMLVANDLRQARQDLGDLRERRDLQLPAQRAELRNEIASLKRQLSGAKADVAQVKSAISDVEGTRLIFPPERTGGSVGTPWPVIAALGCILGAVAGVLAGLFAEFVVAARAHRATRS